MEPDVHLRWGFARELGFPPGGFWLYRRVAPPGETVVTPPRELGAPARLQWGPATRTFGLHFTEQGLRFDLDDTLLPADIAGRPGNPTVSPPCLHFATAHGGPRFRVTITFPLPVHLDAIESGEIVGPVEFPNVGAPAWLGDAAPIAFASSVVQPSGLFLQSAARLDHPITQLAVDVNPRGTYVHSIAFTPVNACAVQPGPAKAAWDQPDPDGWSRWLTPFELPLTQSQWPSRWPGAPDRRRDRPPRPDGRWPPPPPDLEVSLIAAASGFAEALFVDSPELLPSTSVRGSYQPEFRFSGTPGPELPAITRGGTAVTEVVELGVLNLGAP
jgi:hypothetical protein